MSRFAYLPVAALLFAAPLFAAPAAPAALDVKHADLDLTKDADATNMINRLEQAAPSACKRRDGIYDHRLCIAQAVASSVIALNTPALTQAYQFRFGAAPEKVVTP